MPSFAFRSVMHLECRPLVLESFKYHACFEDEVKEVYDNYLTDSVRTFIKIRIFYLQFLLNSRMFCFSHYYNQFEKHLYSATPTIAAGSS